MNRYLAQEDTEMANKHMERCSTSYTIRELQIKKTSRDHDMPFRMASVQRLTTPNAGKDVNQ